MSESLTVSEAVAQFEVSMSTIRRYLRDGKLPNSTKHDGKVHIPVTDLETVGIKRRSSHDTPETVTDTAQLSALQNQLSEVIEQLSSANTENYQLRADLNAERVKTQALDALAQSEQSRISDLRRHISTLEATVSEQRQSLTELRANTQQIEPPRQSDTGQGVSDTPAKKSRWRRWLSL